MSYRVERARPLRARPAHLHIRSEIQKRRGKLGVAQRSSVEQARETFGVICVDFKQWELREDEDDIEVSSPASGVKRPRELVSPGRPEGMAMS